MWDKPVVNRLVGPQLSICEIAYPTASFDVPIPPANEVFEREYFGEDADRYTRGERWLGSSSLDEAKTRMVKGWPAGLEEVRQTIGNIGVPDVPKRRTRRWGLNGEPDLERILFHDPEPFMEMRRIAAPIVRITVDLTTPGFQSSSVLKWRGAPAVILTEMLESAGFNVELVATAYEEDKYPGKVRNTVTFMKIKGADEPANMPVIAGALFTAAAYRVGMFRAWMSAPWTIHFGLGHCRKMPEEFMGDIHIPQDIDNKESAVDFLEKLPTLKRAELRQFLHR